MKITMDGEYVTRKGEEVRIYAVDCGGYFSIHGAVFIDGKWKPLIWTNNGFTPLGTKRDFDLIEKPKALHSTIWVNVYDEGAIPHDFECRAEKDKSDDRQSLLKITLTGDPSNPVVTSKKV